MTDRYYDEDGYPLAVVPIPGEQVMIGGQVFSKRIAELLAVGIRHATRQRGPLTVDALFDTVVTVDDIEGHDEVQIKFSDEDFAFVARLTRAQARELQNVIWSVQNREVPW